MADINAVFISIDIYTVALNKLMGKLDQTTSKMMEASTKFDLSAGNILEAGKAADEAASKMKSFGDTAYDTVDKMQKTGQSLEETAMNMKKTGDAATKATDSMEQTGSTLKGVTDSFISTGKDIGTASKDLLEAGKNVGNVNKSLDSTEKSSSKAGDKLKGFIDKFKGLKSVTKAFDLADSLRASDSKLDRVNDGKQPDEALHSKVAAAAGSSRSTYKDMAGYVSKLSASGDTFKNNDQAIAFAELMQKAVVAGGTDDRGAAMNQVIDTVSKGSLGSDDLKSASGASPLIMKSLQSYTGKSEEDLYKMADDGKITADTIKNAMFSMSEGINGQFTNTKMSFGETWDKLKEGAEQAASGVLGKLNEIVSNPQVQQFVDKLIAGMSLLGDAIGKVCDFIIGNWNIIGPILAYLVGVVLAVMIVDTIAMAAAWLAVNWPILLIVGALAAVIGILVNMGVSFEQVCGVIGGLLGELAAIGYNAFVAIWNGAAAFINFFGNAFSNATANVKILFLDMAINTLKSISNIAKGFSSFLSKLTGKKVDIAAGLTGITDSLNTEKEQAKAGLQNKVYVNDKAYVDPKKFALKGTELGTKAGTVLTNTLKSVDTVLGNNTTKDPTGSMGYQPFNESKGLPGNPSEPLKVEGTGAGGSVNVDMPDEDKEYLKNIAERDYIANVSTNSLAPNIAVQFGDVHETADANKVAGRIKKILREQIAMASEGVY